MINKTKKLIEEILKLGTTNELSEQLGVNRRTILRWRIGKSIPTGENVVKLYDFLLKNSHKI